MRLRLALREKTIMTRIVFLYATAPDEATAKSIALALVEGRHAACVNILGPATSLYRWNGAIETATEVAFVVKTTKTAAPGARDCILALHPYETPAIAELDIGADASNPAFLDWIMAETGPLVAKALQP